MSGKLPKPSANDESVKLVLSWRGASKTSNGRGNFKEREERRRVTRYPVALVVRDRDFIISECIIPVWWLRGLFRRHGKDDGRVDSTVKGGRREGSFGHVLREERRIDNHTKSTNSVVHLMKRCKSDGEKRMVRDIRVDNSETDKGGNIKCRNNPINSGG